jgi:hypothetical protein
VSDELIATYTQDYGTGVFRDSIVSSAGSDMGDFARYRIDPLVHHWSQAPRGFSNLPTYRDVVESWIGSFVRSASEQQLDAFRTVLDAAKAAGGQFSYQDTPETQRVKEAEEDFRGLIESDTWEEYRVKAQSFIKYTLLREARWSRDQTALFDARWARRWICKRAHDLGWTAERFGQIERYSRGYGRHEHRLERIGKKYQWLALYELAARLADNVAMVGAYGEAQKASQEYQGAWRVGLRNIDPSLLVTETYYDGWQQWPRTWWVPIAPVLHELSPKERLAWRSSAHDIVNDPALIEITEPKTGRHWLSLEGFAHWRQSAFVEGHSELQRSTWFRLGCVVVRKSDRTALLNWLQKKTLTSSDDLPSIRLYGEHYIGEYPWHRSLSDLPDWTTPELWRAPPVPTRSTVATYTCEHGSYDYSIEKTIQVHSRSVAASGLGVASLEWASVNLCFRQRTAGFL